MNLYNQYKILLEKKDHIINRLKNLSDEQKQILINFFEKKPNLEVKIDWNNKDLAFDDFKEVMNVTKTERKKSVKQSGIKGLVKGVDYLEFPVEYDYINAYIPLTYEASKLIAGKDIGGVEGEWCTAYQKQDRYWKQYCEKNNIVLIYVIVDRTKKFDEIDERPFEKYAIACSVKLLDADKQWCEIFTRQDNSISLSNFTLLTGIAEQDIIEHKDILIKANELILSKLTIYDKYDIIEYTINPDGTCDVSGSVDLSGRGLTSLKEFNFGTVSNWFDCSNNELTDLIGAPKKVGGSFFCNNNQLKTLNGSPKEVDGNFDCTRNELKNLKGAPKEVDGAFDCTFNDLRSLNGIPEYIGGNFYFRTQRYGEYEPTAEEMEIVPFNNGEMVLLRYYYTGIDTITDRPPTEPKTIEEIAGRLHRSEKSIIKKLKELRIWKEETEIKESNVLNIYESLVLNEYEDDMNYDYYEEYDDYEYQVFYNIKDGKKIEFGGKIDPKQYHTALKKFIKMGTVSNFPEKKIFDWKDMVIEHIWLLKILTEINGHSCSFPSDIFLDIFNNEDNPEFSNWVKQKNEKAGKKLYSDSGSDWESFISFLEEEYDLSSLLPNFSNGQLLVSDYGLEPLLKLAYELYNLTDPSEILVCINKILDVTHQRSDLAELFVYGGSAELDFIQDYMKNDKLNEKIGKHILKSSIDYSMIKNQAIENAKKNGYDYDFILYLKDFYKNIHKDINSLNKDVPETVEIDGTEITIHKWELSGSYAKGNPTPDSDVDVKVYYSGDIDEIDVAMEFAGSISGNYGSYDCHAEKIG